MRIINAFVFVITVSVFINALAPGVAQAQGQKAMQEKWLSVFERDLADAEVVLRGKDQSEWTHDEIENYLFNALFVLYNDIGIYVGKHRQHPADWKTLREVGQINTWPKNPFNNWKPIEINYSSQEFSAGNACVIVCPTDWYSGYPNATAMSFVIHIFGTDEDFIPAKEPKVYFEWAQTPAGTAFSSGSYWETYEKRKAKAEAKAKLQSRRR